VQTGGGVMPAAFFGHGSPMNALEHNRYTEAWRAFGAAVTRPRAILVVSAHWYINASAVTAMTWPRTIHDFYGFPDELFAVRYPAPGDPELAQQVADLAHPQWVGLDHDSWGIDHGTWSVLVHAFPDADIPVVQLAINAAKPLEYHFELGARLGALRHDGVLMIASGNVVHNLGLMDPGCPDSGTDWAQRFDEDIRATMTRSPGALVEASRHRDFHLAVPTPDHFIPLLYLAGLADRAEHDAEVLVQGYAYGSLSMTSYTLDLPDAIDGREAGGAPRLPEVPADSTNL
jgi:4,5-DOPA dioxygenase extradiol